ncbi:MAG: hypothetical protein ABI183_17640 [Polyangiaceae bacterium]
MTKLTPCRSCHRHCRSTETSCPFCGIRHVAIGASLLAIVSLAVACDGQAAQSPNSNVVIPTSSAVASSGATTPDDAGGVAPVVPTPTPTPTTTTTTPPDMHRAVPMYGMPPAPANR